MSHFTVMQMICKYICLFLEKTSVLGNLTACLVEIALGLVLYRVSCQCRALVLTFVVICRKV